MVRSFGLASHYVLLALCACVSRVVAQSAVSSSTYNDIARYHGFASAAYSSTIDCKSPPAGSRIVQFINASSTDTQATLFYAPDRNELVISFRGTSTPPDLDVDLDFTLIPVNVSGVSISGGRVHRSFQRSFNSVASPVVSSIQSARGRFPGASLVVTGHSLGAGIAGIGSAMLIDEFPGLSVYTYGEPRNGNAAWADFVASKVPKYFRVTHANDGVPQIPPELLGFQHHSTEYWLSSNGSNSASTTFKCSGAENKDCNGGQDYGSGPINGAHIAYFGLTSATLFNLGCGFSAPGLA